MAISPISRQEAVRWGPGIDRGGLRDEMVRLWGPVFDVGFGRGGLHDEMARFFADYFWASTGTSSAYLNPVVDLVDTAENIQVQVELPGINREDVEVILKNDSLIIKGEKREEKEEKGDDRYYMERRYGRFSRTLTLPSGIKGDRAVVKFADGVLRITLPKTDEEKTGETRLEVK